MEGNLIKYSNEGQKLRALGERLAAKKKKPTFENAILLAIEYDVDPKTLANLSSQGTSPPSYHQGQTVIYNRDALLAWLNKRIFYVRKKMPNYNWKILLNVKKWWIERHMKKGWDSKLSLELDKIIIQLEQKANDKHRCH